MKCFGHWRRDDMLKSQDSHGLAPLPSQSITRTRVTKTYERVGGGSTLCVCMHACLHPRSHYPLGSRAGPRDQSIPQCEHRPGEGKGVSENSRGYSANLRGILLNVLPLHTLTTSLRRHPRLKAIKCNVKASYDGVFFIVGSPFRCLGERSQNVAF